MKPLLLSSFALVLAAAMLAPSFAATVPPGTLLSLRQEMIRNNFAEPNSLDPALVGGVNASNIVLDLFEPLVALDHHSRAVPGAAESWRQADPTTWVFKLRKGALWSNGEPVTAQDFVYAWRRLLDPKTGAMLAVSNASFILNGLAINEGKLPPSALGARAIDATTLEVKTTGPLPFVPMLMTNPVLAPVPRAVIEKSGSAWTRPGTLVGNGAYVLKAWQVNSKVVVEKNPKYWDAADVQLTKVTYLAVEDGNADLKLYQSGEEDMMSRLPAGTFAALKAQFPKELHFSRLIGLRYHALNNADPLLKDARVRQALSMVIDRELLASRVTAEGELPTYGLTLAGSEGVDPVRYEWADWPMDRRVAEAKKLLAAAGVRPGTRLRFMVDMGDFQKRIAVFTASEWKTKLGLETDLDTVEYKVMYQKMHDGDFQAGRAGWVASTADITDMLDVVQCGHDANVNRSCDKAADALIAQARVEVDPARRRQLLTQAVRQAMAAYPMVPLLQYAQSRLVKPWIGGYEDANDQGLYRSKDFYVIKH